MKLGSCTLLLANQEDTLAQRHIPLIKKAGFDYTEISLARLLNLSPARRIAYRACFEDAGLPTLAFNNANPPDFSSIGPNASKETTEAYWDNALEAAQYMGVKLITMSGPSKKTVPADFSWEQGFDAYAEYLHGYCARAEALDIRIALEPINDEENNFVRTVADAVSVLKRVNRPNMIIVVDMYHFFKQDDEWDSLLAACQNGYVGHIHFARPEDRRYPRLNDQSACFTLLRDLLRHGYTGDLSVEAYATDPESELPQAVRALRRCLEKREIDKGAHFVDTHIGR